MADCSCARWRRCGRWWRAKPLAEIVPELPPAVDDLVLIKQYASAFFGTSLAAMLTAQRIDTLVITGCSHQRMRARTAVDAMQARLPAGGGARMRRRSAQRAA